MSDERPRRTAHGQESGKAPASGWQLIAVQSISCLVILLIAFVFRLVGGSAFDQLRSNFNESIMDNSLIATIATLWNTSLNNDDSGLTSASNSINSTDKTTMSGTGDTTTAKQTAKETTASSTAQTNTSTVVTTVAASGGNDIPVASKVVMYAPEGAAFASLKVNRLAVKPLEKGTMTSCYGYRENPTKGGISFHQGLDIAADTGSPIAAMYYGVVSEVGKNNSYGNYVRLYHGNGVETLYAHCSEILVQKNAIIKAGEIVAKVGSTGDSTGPHVHIEVKLNGINYNPTNVVPMDSYA